LELWSGKEAGLTKLSNLNRLRQMCSGIEAGSYLRRIDFVYHSTLGLRVIKKKQKGREHLVEL